MTWNKLERSMQRMKNLQRTIIVILFTSVSPPESILSISLCFSTASSVSLIIDSISSRLKTAFAFSKASFPFWSPSSTCFWTWQWMGQEDMVPVKRVGRLPEWTLNLGKAFQYYQVALQSDQASPLDISSFSIAASPGLSFPPSITFWQVLCPEIYLVCAWGRNNWCSPSLKRLLFSSDTVSTGLSVSSDPKLLGLDLWSGSSLSCWKAPPFFLQLIHSEIFFFISKYP